MKERTATFCGYVLFITIFLSVVVGIVSLIRSRTADPVVDDTNMAPVTVEAHIGTNTTPPILYVQVHIKKGHHIYSINAKTPEPIRTLLVVEPSPEFGVTGDWFTITKPKTVTIPGFGELEEHAYGALFGLHINPLVDIKTLKIKGSITVAPCNDERCYLPEKIPFEATVVE
ncbi:MAG: hypothetical protein WC315_00100 [Candidatus Omnitrophota bacterium]|jgi:hypothetical protein